MWDLYLSACAATFHNGIIDLHQILFANGINNGLPLVRWASGRDLGRGTVFLPGAAHSGGMRPGDYATRA